MQSPRSVLTPDALVMLQNVANAGGFAAAARQMGLVPSALTYRVRQIEDALDVLLFDRRSRNARLTPAGTELLSEGRRVLSDVAAIAERPRTRAGDDTLDLIRELRMKGCPELDVYYHEMEGGRHEPHTWGEAMPVFLKWCLGGVLSPQS